MRFAVVALYLAAMATPASALTCAGFEDLTMKSKANDELSRRYLGGWLEGFGGSVLATSAMDRSRGSTGLYCLPTDNNFSLTNADIVGLYDQVIVTWPDVDKSDPNKCLADAVIMLGLQQKYPCR